MLLTENDKRWSKIITEEYHVDNQKASWMSKVAQIHELYESAQLGGSNVSGGIYSTPLNTIGLGNPANPYNPNSPGNIGNTGSDFHFNQVAGSGDIPMSTLPMALEIAAMTIGFELVPVIPANGPWTMLSYMDFPYAGGKLPRFNETAVDGKGPDRENKPIYIKVIGTSHETASVLSHVAVTGIQITPSNNDIAVIGDNLGNSRIDNSPIYKVYGVAKYDLSTTTWSYVDNVSIADVFSVANSTAKADLVTGAADHVQGFANFYDNGEDPMTRAENETGVGETMGARMFTKLVQMGSYEVTGSVTRQQLQDMPLYGVDVVGQVLEAMQNEISQHINNRILDRVFKLGVENYKAQREYQGVDCNLFINPDAASYPYKFLTNFASAGKFKDLSGTPLFTNALAAWGVENAWMSASSENVTTNQRRIMSRVLYAKNLIANVSRRGYANWGVTNFTVLSALQDAAGFVVAPSTNTLTQDNSQSLYFAGSIMGLNIYVDPYMTADDCRICIGRKSDGKTPGVIFMPYILADTVQTIVEGTMAPKLLVNSRFAIVDAGFYPEQNYYTFMVDAGAGVNSSLNMVLPTNNFNYFI